MVLNRSIQYVFPALGLLVACSAPSAFAKIGDLPQNPGWLKENNCKVDEESEAQSCKGPSPAPARKPLPKNAELELLNVSPACKGEVEQLRYQYRDEVAMFAKDKAARDARAEIAKDMAERLSEAVQNLSQEEYAKLVNDYRAQKISRDEFLDALSKKIDSVEKNMATMPEKDAPGFEDHVRAMKYEDIGRRVTMSPNHELVVTPTRIKAGYMNYHSCWAYWTVIHHARKECRSHFTIGPDHEKFEQIVHPDHSDPEVCKAEIAETAMGCAVEGLEDLPEVRVGLDFLVPPIDGKFELHAPTAQEIMGKNGISESAPKASPADEFSYVLRKLPGLDASCFATADFQPMVEIKHAPIAASMVRPSIAVSDSDDKILFGDSAQEPNSSQLSSEGQPIVTWGGASKR